MNLKGQLNQESPKKVTHLNTQAYIGVGPKQSFDQKLNYINENTTLAQRIDTIGKRRHFISGFIGNSRFALSQQNYPQPY